MWKKSMQISCTGFLSHQSIFLKFGPISTRNASPGFPWWFPVVELPGLGARPDGFRLCIPKPELFLPGGAAVVFEYLHIQELGG